MIISYDDVGVSAIGVFSETSMKLNATALSLLF
jgi:hypothetical protein